MTVTAAIDVFFAVWNSLDPSDGGYAPIPNDGTFTSATIGVAGNYAFGRLTTSQPNEAVFVAVASTTNTAVSPLAQPLEMAGTSGAPYPVTFTPLATAANEFAFSNGGAVFETGASVLQLFYAVFSEPVTNYPFAVLFSSPPLFAGVVGIGISGGNVDLPIDVNNLYPGINNTKISSPFKTVTPGETVVFFPLCNQNNNSQGFRITPGDWNTDINGGAFITGNGPLYPQMQLQNGAITFDDPQPETTISVYMPFTGMSIAIAATAEQRATKVLPIGTAITLPCMPCCCLSTNIVI